MRALARSPRLPAIEVQGFLSLKPQGRGDEIVIGAEHHFTAIFRRQLGGPPAPGNAHGGGLTDSPAGSRSLIARMTSPAAGNYRFILDGMRFASFSSACSYRP